MLKEEEEEKEIVREGDGSRQAAVEDVALYFPAHCKIPYQDKKLRFSLVIAPDRHVVTWLRYPVLYRERYLLL